jgi:hypothetical protein
MRISSNFRLAMCGNQDDVHRASPYEFERTSDVCSFAMTSAAFGLETDAPVSGGEPWPTAHDENSATPPCFVTLS